MRLSRQLFCAVLAISSLGASRLLGDESKASETCRSFLASAGYEPDNILKEVELEHSATNETHRLSELFAPDSENLALKSPTIVLNAPQILWLIIKEAGVQEIVNRRTGVGTLKQYDLFSRGGPLTDNRIIIGHDEALHHFVRTVKAQARGHKSSKTTPLLVGTRGTAKTETLEILKTARKNASLRTPRYYDYTFEFEGLEQIPALGDFLRKEPLRTEINDSPFVVLPRKLQDALIQKVKPTINQAIQMDPLPKREADPKVQFIVSRILEHYAKEKGHNLSVEETIDVLDKHILIRRVIMGTAGNFPIIPAQLKDVDEAGLFMSKNAAVALEYGASHPMAWNMGLVTQGNRGAVLWDEFLKNDGTFKRKQLTFFQSKRLQAAGAFELNLDTLNAAATNTEDVVAELEANPKSPMTDRFMTIRMSLLIEPQLIAKSIAYEQRGLRARDLSSVDSEFKPVDLPLLHQLYPDRAGPKQPVVTSDRRFALEMDLKEKQPVHISPHTLMFVGMTVALSRMEFDPAKMSAYKDAFPNVKWEGPILVDRVSRLKAMMGQIRVDQSNLIELWSLSKVANEGEFGMSHRDMERWWEIAMEEAQAEGANFTITPMLLRAALAKGVKDKMILDGDLKRGAIVMRNADIVFNEFTKPEMINDMNLAIMGGPRSEILSQIYESVVFEMLNLSQDQNSKTYTTASGEPKVIDHARLKEIGELYKRETGRELSFNEVATMTLGYQRVSGESNIQPEYNQSLLRAIQQYHSRAVQKAENVNMTRLLSISKGSVPDAKPAERARASEFLKVLVDELGYNAESAQRSLEVISKPIPQ